MTKRQIIPLLILFIILITSIRLLWIDLTRTPDHPVAVQGQLDLRDWDFSSSKALSLDGQWAFYPDELLMPGSAHDSASSTIRTYIDVPHNWGDALSPSKPSPIGYGTYRLRILVKPDADQRYSIRTASIPTSSAIYANGKLLGQSGQPAVTKEGYKARSTPYTATFSTDQDTIDLAIQVANFDNLSLGGIFLPVKFGSDIAVHTESQFIINMQLIVAIVLLMHVIYTVILYLIGTRLKALPFLALLVSFAILTILSSDDMLLFVWIPMDYEWISKIRSFAYLGSAIFLLEFVKHLFPEYSKVRAFRWYSWLSLFFMLTILFMPVHFMIGINAISAVIVVIPFLIVPVILLQITLRKERDAIYLLLGSISILLNIVWGIVKHSLWVELIYYPFDMILTFLMIATFCFKRYFRTVIQTHRLADQLKEAAKQKDDFLANTSHELRNPLHGMLNIAQSVLDNETHALHSSNAKSIELLITIGRRMSFVLNDLLDLTRLKESGIRLQASSIHIQTVAAGVLDMLRFMTEGKPVRFINQIPDTFPAVYADENRLIQILFNLLHNALKYTNEGSITVDARLENGKACILITDTGIGMSEAAQQTIFQPYQQGDSGSSEIGGGIGLGLSISKQLVELHGGTLDVRSTPDQGSEFSFTLSLSHPDEVNQQASQPAAPAVADCEIEAACGQAAASAASADVSTADESAPNNVSPLPPAADLPKVLIVDDDPLNLMMLVQMLSSHHYNIVTTTSGVKALSMLDNEEWDLLITDVMMPHMSGYELTSAIRTRFTSSELPILLLTARSRAEDVEAGFRSGANDYVTKPIDATEMRSRVRALTELKRTVRERLRMEAAWLQAQIQPHFLFNTLNSIAALSEINIPRMVALIEKFGDYLQASFDFRNTERLVPIQHELGLVQAYLFIEKERFEERLHVIWDVEDHLQLHIPPLSIQPLVENAVRHGILRRIQGGTLHIQITDYGDHAEISIGDNGVGMNQEILNRLPIISEHAGISGVGLLNTDRRLKQIYGKGLQIYSVPNQGTTITFTVTK
ncbi:response regulator [Paenibacillus oenotherae]|uniref:histidine kinase n=2 Tax=Paenibacillus oenotherae TaxID=1435645 RepID=A0ABS7D330_9BACL|nr:response regulator [Paenibacillus oenotherae]